MTQPRLKVQTRNRRGKLVGRPRKEPPRDAAERIEKYAASGFNVISIGRKFGVTKDLLYIWLADDPKLREAFDRGSEAERIALHACLYRAAMKGNVVAAMFLLKSRHGYKEGDQEGQANRVAVTFNLPGAMPLEAFARVVNEPANPAAVALPGADAVRT